MTSPTPALDLSTARGSKGALTRLICFPHLGGKALGFQRWGAELGDVANVWGVDLSGRHSRSAEPLLETAEEVLDDVQSVVDRIADVPFALFGHSMGGWIAYETALACERRGLPILGLVVSGTPEPTILASRARLTGLSDAEILQRCLAWGVPRELLRAPQFRETTFPAILADAMTNDSYRPPTSDQKRTLNAPMLALAGRDDDVVPASQVSGWARVSANWQGLNIVPGNHFFTVESEQVVLRLLRQFCTTGLLRRRSSDPSVQQNSASRTERIN
ncbi:MAG: thioesterase II family protein [Nesterenkonia sp.]